jgi:hypothetical protein
MFYRAADLDVRREWSFPIWAVQAVEAKFPSGLHLIGQNIIVRVAYWLEKIQVRLLVATDF